MRSGENTSVTAKLRLEINWLTFFKEILSRDGLNTAFRPLNNGQL